jgi:hypothetical protein
VFQVPRFNVPERGLFSLPCRGPHHHSSQESLYTPKHPKSSLLVPPFTSYRTFPPFYSFIFRPCRWETEKIVALRHCVPRRTPSASNPSSPRSTANIIPSYMLAASLLSPVLPVGSVVLPHASWPGKRLSIIYFFAYLFSSIPHPSLFPFCNVSGWGRSMHVMLCAPRDHMGCRVLFAGASHLPPHICLRFPHPSAPFITPVLSGAELS